MRRDELIAKKEQVASLIEEMRTLNGTILADGGRKATAEEEQVFAKLEQEVNDTREIITREERVLSLAASGSFSEIDGGSGKAKTFEEWRSGSGVSRPWDLPDVQEASYLYWTRGERGLSNEEYRVLSRASGAAGNFLVPTDFYQQVIRASRWIGAVGDTATTITTASGDSIQVPQNLSHGTAAWVAESGTYTPSDETFAQATMNAYKAAAKIIVSEELLQDSAFPLDSFLATEFGERIGALIEAAYITGTGSGQPLGITDATSGVTNYSLAAGQVTTLTYAELVKAIFQIPAQYRDGMSILCSDAQMLRMVLLVDGQQRPIWAVSTAAGQPDTLLGYPVSTNPTLPAPGANAKSMIMGNFRRGYMIRRVDGFSMQRQNELHSDSGQVGFRGFLRLDGKPVLPDALRIVSYAAT